MKKRNIGISLFLWFMAFATFGKTVPDEVAEKNRDNAVMNYLQANVYSFGVSETEFDQALDLVQKVWGPRVAQKGKSLRIIRNWADSTVNAYADQSGNFWNLHMFGGLARRSGMTKLGFTMVACHELGHHAGGAPKYSGQWAADEGQADYWGAKECMTALGFTQAEIDAGALSTASVLASLSGSPTPSPDRLDPNRVPSTSHSHPAAQCRLDTYRAGNRCTVHGESSPDDPKVASCYYYPSGVASSDSRPRCWFAPVDQGKPTPGQPSPQPTPGPTPPPKPPTCPPPPACPACPPPKTCKWLCL